MGISTTLKSVVVTSNKKFPPKIKKLCKNCRKVTLKDTSPEFKVQYDDQGKPCRVGILSLCEEIHTKYSLTDELPGLLKLKRSSRRGCHFCGYLREMLSNKQTTKLLKTKFDICPTISETEKISIAITFLWNSDFSCEDKRFYLDATVVLTNRGIRFILRSHLKTAEGYEDLAKWLALPTPSTLSYTSRDHTQWMKSMIEECKKHNHTLPTVDYVPDTLLDVQGETPRLISATSINSTVKDQSIRYAALSYCWGNPEEAKYQLTTTAETIEQRRAGVPYDEMPPVLRDAVNVTKNLEIPFLWIDSLCIIQDNISHWENQCPQMDKIYGHAEVTILAASSNSCRESFLQPKGIDTLLPFHSRQRPDLTETDLFESRLGNRGWAVQERILSTRRIIFGRSNIHFSCPNVTRAFRPHQAPTQIEKGLCQVRNVHTNKLYECWTLVLNEFGKLSTDSFTKPTDLLPAISGIAAYFGSRLGDEYCAGHWRKDLDKSLMWQKMKSSLEPKSSYLRSIHSADPYIVPSWSQLGKSGFQFMSADRLSRDNHAPEIDAKISLGGSNPFGAIQDAELKVRSYTMRFLDVYTIKPTSLRYTDFCCAPWVVRFTRKNGRRIFDCHFWVDYSLQDAEVHEDAKEWKWVLLGTQEYSCGKLPFGLLIYRAKDSRWYRVGVFQSDFSGQHNMLLDDFISMGQFETVTIY
ncbi:heterokaryon incompatibility protein-domain-containing protein [Xylaria scruposa]|nr:heterokaryon incompatibility protein-domain-containing protein [Xylaria scruposa]